jgi:ribosome-associated protein
MRTGAVTPSAPGPRAPPARLYWGGCARQNEAPAREEVPLVRQDDVREQTEAGRLPHPSGDLEYAQALLDVVVDRQGSDVVLLDLTALGVFADYFVIATVDNIRQARAIEDALSEATAKHGEKARVEGEPEEGWILIDAGDGIFVHLFSLEARVYYDLEGLWHRAQEIVRVQ